MLLLAQQLGAQPIDPKKITDAIDAQGAMAVVQELNAGTGQQWRQVIQKIKTGAAEWLVVADRLLTGTDAGRTTDLYFALSIALTRNAPGVLSLVGPNLPVEQVCSVPYIEPDDKTIAAHRKLVHSALQKVKSPELKSQKMACLEAVDR